MTKQPEALRLAEAMETPSLGTRKTLDEAATELRRLHQSELEGWRYANELEQERQRLKALNLKLLSALKNIAEMYSYEESSIESARTFYEAKCVACAAIAKAEGGAA